MLSVTAIVWGAGFVINDQLLAECFPAMPGLINALRFAVASLCVIVAFAKKVHFTKTNWLYGAVSGAMLFGGFLLQLLGLNYSTPSHCGFFSAAYVLFVPLITWIIGKKRPSLSTFAALALALAGMVILNYSAGESASGQATLWGDLISLGGALMFGLQIIWADYLLKGNKTDECTLTVTQILSCTAFFVVYTLAVESKNYSAVNFDFGFIWWRLLLMGAIGSAFGYYAQTYAQSTLTPFETSLIIACESPIGAFLSVLVGIEALKWNVVVGGVLVVAAIVLCQVAPAKAKPSAADGANFPQSDAESSCTPNKFTEAQPTDLPSEESPSSAADDPSM